jgi:hypothetical protein
LKKATHPRSDSFLPEDLEIQAKVKPDGNLLQRIRRLHSPGGSPSYRAALAMGGDWYFQTEAGELADRLTPELLAGSESRDADD